MRKLVKCISPNCGKEFWAKTYKIKIKGRVARRETYTNICRTCMNRLRQKEQRKSSRRIRAVPRELEKNIIIGELQQAELKRRREAQMKKMQDEQAERIMKLKKLRFTVWEWLGLEEEEFKEKAGKGGTCMKCGKKAVNPTATLCKRHKTAYTRWRNKQRKQQEKKPVMAISPFYPLEDINKGKKKGMGLTPTELKDFLEKEEGKRKRKKEGKKNGNV